MKFLYFGISFSLSALITNILLMVNPEFVFERELLINIGFILCITLMCILLSVHTLSFVTNKNYYKLLYNSMIFTICNMFLSLILTIVAVIGDKFFMTNLAIISQWMLLLNSAYLTGLTAIKYWKKY